METYRGTKGPTPDRLHACLATANDAIAKAAGDDPALKWTYPVLVDNIINHPSPMRN